MSNELKPCPFCGGKAFVWRTNHKTYVQCKNFNAFYHLVQMAGKTDEEAFEKWNRRYNDEVD